MLCGMGKFLYGSRAADVLFSWRADARPARCPHAPIPIFAAVAPRLHACPHAPSRVLATESTCYEMRADITCLQGRGDGEEVGEEPDELGEEAGRAVGGF